MGSKTSLISKDIYVGKDGLKCVHFVIQNWQAYVPLIPSTYLEFHLHLKNELLILLNVKNVLCPVSMSNQHLDKERFMTKKLLSLTLFCVLLGANLFAKSESVRSNHGTGGCKLCKVNKEKCEKNKYFKHKIQLQLADANGFLVENTEFWVTLNIVKHDNLVTVNIPLINFQTGQVSQDDPYYPSGEQVPGFPPAGGYIYTTDGFLPECVTPNDLVPVSIVAASNNGMSPVFSYAQDPATLPVPPVGYIIQVTNAGELQIQCAGTFGNIIPPGPQIVMPCSITYVVGPKEKLCKNSIIAKGFSNTTQFTGGFANTGFRDLEINDAYDGVVAFSWGDNSMFADKTNNILNCMVAVGSVKNGKLKVRKPVNISNITTPDVTAAFDHAVTINRTDKKNIVVSYTVIQGTGTIPCPGSASTYYRAVSFDGGKTWPAEFNGPLNLGAPWQKGPCSFDVGDARGVGSDQYGNIWYAGTIRYDGSGISPLPGNFVNIPFFAVSFDKGRTFQTIFTAPTDSSYFIPGINAYDFPMYAFGTNEEGQYGLYYTCALFNSDTLDGMQVIGFIPINGFGLSNIDVGGALFDLLPQLSMEQVTSDITASDDGRVWLIAAPSPEGSTPYSFIQPAVVAFKSPGGTIGSNWAGSWDFAMIVNEGNNYVESTQIAQPFFGFSMPGGHAIIYDTTRKALYAQVNNQVPSVSQDMQIYFAISRDNGMTWSDPIAVSNSSFANRGFMSMALDEVTGDLVFSWHDGRNDPTFEAVQFFGAVIPAKQLDKMVKAIPLSNPLFEVPSAD